jgi:hypothetical protein
MEKFIVVQEVNEIRRRMRKTSDANDFCSPSLIFFRRPIVPKYSSRDSDLDPSFSLEEGDAVPTTGDADDDILFGARVNEWGSNAVIQRTDSMELVSRVNECCSLTEEMSEL